MGTFNLNSMASGKFLLQGIIFSKTKFGKDMISGTVVAENQEELHFVSFDESVVKAVKTIGQSSFVADCSISVEEYQGQKNGKLVSISNVYEANDEVLNQFLKRIPAKGNLEIIFSTIKKNCSPKLAGIIKEIIKAKGKDLGVAMAAQYGGIHDGVVGGLVNHIRKLTLYTEVAMNNFREKTFTQSEIDLIFLGIFVHDIGKMLEIKGGSYTEIAIVPHTYLGIEVMEEFKDSIISAYGEMFYRELQAIILEHHGEYGEPPKTVYAYIVHQIDLLDSRLSGLQKILDDGVSEGQRISFDDFRMNFNRYGK